MNIAFDIDGVLCNFTREFVKTINTLWPGKLPPDYQPNSWWYDEFLTASECKAALTAYGKVWDHWLVPEALPGCWELHNWLDSFRQNNIDIYFCTARMKTAGLSLMQQTKMWLERHGLLRDYTALIIMGDSHKEKAQVYDALGVEWSIDDKIETVRACQALPGHKAFLLDQRWNRSVTDLPRVQSVQEFCQRVLEYHKASQTEHVPVRQ